MAGARKRLRESSTSCEFAFPFLAEQGQPGADVRKCAFVVDEIILPVAQAALGWIFEEEVDVMLAVMSPADHLDLRLLHGSG